ncbi:MAG: TetR/AcrR family transcriptional regulator [Desulfuromonadaceae bacterium]|nr:TetR/AcrR family transcriptional regulator [Desulfuromonadaceae bacterium]MDD2849289.1 TetR/AcrR family transcriptional regulator [Desulfuromonadaceae bacterium]MDD4131916.1 TetR/AcrR family transcriptional regulator [Desulfuromonadaceae bacterium]
MDNSMIQIITKRKTREEILELSVPLFARYGYDGVSMRDIAAAMGLTPAALYYHFTDKENLYLDVVAHALRERSAELKGILDGLGSPWARLEEYVAGLARLMTRDKDFLRLMQWVLLDSDEVRHHKLSEQVFSDLFVAVYNLAAELDSRHDAHMLAVSIIGLVFFHYQAGTTRQFMPGHRPRQDNPAVLAQHVIGLLRNCLGKSDEGTGYQTVADKSCLK